MKTIIKSHGEEVTDIYDKEIPKVGSNYTCLVLIIQKVIRDINDSLSVFSDDTDGATRTINNFFFDFKITLDYKNVLLATLSTSYTDY